MSSRACLRAAALALAALIVPACADDVDSGDTSSTVTVRVSVARQDRQVLEDNLIPSISGDGRWVAFSSASPELTDNDSNGLVDVFVKDRLNGEVENITNKLFAFPGQMDAESPSISPNGRFVAFVSTGKFINDASFPDDKSNTIKIVYVYDRQDNVFRCPIPTTPIPDADLLDPCLSGNGRYLTFMTEATNVGLATSGISQVVRCDFGPNYNTVALNLVSHAEGAPATGANGGSFIGRISGDGTRVAFQSLSTNLAAAQDAHGGLDIYLWVEGAVPPVRLASVIGPSAGGTRLSAWPSISLDGNFVAFHHRDDANLIPRVIQRYDVAGNTTLAASDPGHTPGSFDMTTISGDGRYVGYVSGTGGPVAHVWRYDMNSASSELLSQSTFGVTGNQTSFRVVFSANGVWAAWNSQASNLVAGDTNGVIDVFVRGPSSAP